MQPKTGDYVPLNRALNACLLIDDAGNAMDETSCQFTIVPVSITSRPAHFTADGSTQFIHSVARFDSTTNEQIVKGCLIDVNEGTAYSLFSNYCAYPDGVSTKAPVMIGFSDYPEYNPNTRLD